MFPFLYIDADSCSDRLIAALRRLSIDVVAANEEGLMAIADESQLLHAVSLGRPILTANFRDFIPLHSAWARDGRDHPGMFLRTHGRMSPEALADQIAGICRSRTELELRNTLLWVG